MPGVSTISVPWKFCSMIRWQLRAMRTVSTNFARSLPPSHQVLTAGAALGRNWSVPHNGSLTGYFASADAKGFPESLYGSDRPRVAHGAPVGFVCCICKCGACIHVDEDPGAASSPPMKGVGVRQFQRQQRAGKREPNTKTRWRKLAQ